MIDLEERRDSFTLIEFLIVISIIMILSGVIVANIGNPTADARDGRRVSDLEQIRIALELYYDVEDHYPEQAVPSEEVLNNNSPTGQELVNNDYLATIPVDPTDDVTHKYWYCGTPDGSRYALKANLETDNDALRSDYDKDWPKGMIAEGGVGCDCNDTAGYQDDGGIDGEQTSTPYIYCIRN